MLLVLDAGNTNITIGIYDSSENLVATYRLISDKYATVGAYKKQIKSMLGDFHITKCIIASVVNNLDKTLKRAVDELYNIKSIILNSELNLDFKLLVNKPEEVGADRIANTAGAKQYLKPAIVIDLGTATTFDIVDKDGNFIGGTIMPGLAMQLSMLNNCTSKLPKIDIDECSNAIGKNTVDCILSGVIRGTGASIDGLIAQCETELNEKATIIITGGYANLISKYMLRKPDYINQNLTLEGLKYIYNLNK